jgi:hypothetical protein
MERVFPGVELTFAIFLLKSTFISDDFPTLDRPTKAIDFL